MPIRSLRSIVAKKSLNTISKAATVSEAARLMKQAKVGAIIVLDGTRLAGIFTERDALFRVLAEDLDPATTTLANVMTAQPQTMHPDEPFVQALLVMYKCRFRHLPVVEFERPLGMVSVRDALDDDLAALRDDLGQREHLLF